MEKLGRCMKFSICPKDNGHFVYPTFLIWKNKPGILHFKKIRRNTRI